MCSAPLLRRRAMALLAALPWALAPAHAAKPKPKTKTHRTPAPRPGPSYANNAAAMAFAEEAATQRGLSATWLRQQLAQAHRIDAVRQLVMPPAAGTAKNWAAYRSRFVEPQRIGAGVAFWQDNEAWLFEAEERWGVPAAIVVAIVGVETFYGRVTGGFRLIDALATLAFDFPTGRKDRSDYFRSELTEFFVLCQRDGRDPQVQKGSYAGAQGLPQFMPSSINRYAVDMDGDGHTDLLGSPADVVGSVAHYLQSFGWQRGLPTHFDVAVPVDSSERALLLAPDITPTFTAAQMAEHGAELEVAGRVHSGLLALVELQNGALAPSYLAGTANFYTLTRYNWSSYYAMAVIELAAAIKRQKLGA